MRACSKPLGGHVSQVPRARGMELSLGKPGKNHGKTWENTYGNIFLRYVLWKNVGKREKYGTFSYEWLLILAKSSKYTWWIFHDFPIVKSSEGNLCGFSNWLYQAEMHSAWSLSESTVIRLPLTSTSKSCGMGFFFDKYSIMSTPD